MKNNQGLKGSLLGDPEDEFFPIHDLQYRSKEPRVKSPLIPKEMEKYQQKILDKRKKSNQKLTQGYRDNISLPQNMEHVVLKYGLNPNKNSSMRSRIDNIPSYKKDAMRLIASWIYMQIGNSFEELKRRSFSYPPKFQRNKSTDALKLNKLRLKNMLGRIKENDENDSNTSNQELVDQRRAPSNQGNTAGVNLDFKKRFEMRKNKIKQTLEEGQLIRSQHQNSKSQVNLLQPLNHADNARYSEESQSMQNRQASISPKYSPGEEQLYIKVDDRNGMSSLRMSSQYGIPSDIEADQLRIKRLTNNDSFKSAFQNCNFPASVEMGNTQEYETPRNNVSSSQKSRRQQNGNFVTEESQIDTEEAADTVGPINVANFPIAKGKEAQKEKSNEKQSPEMIKPAKKIASFIQKDFLDKPIKQTDFQTRNNGSKSRQPDMIEMSFSENPFGHRPSTFQSSLVSAGLNHSPDFKKEYKKDLGSNFNTMSQQYNQSLSGPHQKQKQLGVNTESRKEEQKKRHKQLQDSINSLVGQLEERKDKTQRPEDPIEEENKVGEKPQTQTSKRIEEIRKKLNKEKEQKNQEIIQSKPSSRIEELRKRINLDKLPESNKMNEENLFDYRKESKVNSSSRETPLGFMIKVDENSYQFQESRAQSQRDSPDIREYSEESQKVFKLKPKKIQLQSNNQMNEQMQFQNFVRKKSSSDSQFRLNPLSLRSEKTIEMKIKLGKRLYLALEKIRKERLTEGLYEISQKSIQNCNGEIVQKLFLKLLLTRGWRALKNQTRKNKIVHRLRSIAQKNMIEMGKREQKYFWQWKLYTQMQHQISKAKQKNQNSIQALLLLIKHKYIMNLKSSFRTINEYQKAMILQEKQQSQQRAIQKLHNYIISKELQMVNNNFQKYRKLVFLNSYDQTLLKIGHLVQRKRKELKKEGFKEIINYCLRNEQFKRQYDVLNQNYFNQVNRAKVQQLKRMVKIISLHHEKQGFKALQIEYQQQCLKRQILHKMMKSMSKYNKFTGNLLMGRAFKKWQKKAENEKKKDTLKKQACRKIKLMLSVSRNRILRQRFDLWKNETSNFINFELTRLNQEKEHTRNLQFEQKMINIWWISLKKGYCEIKKYSKQQKALDYLVKKKSVKQMRIDKVGCFNNWKSLVYKRKILKVNMTVLFKNLENRNKKLKIKWFRRWERRAQDVNKQEQCLRTILVNRLTRQRESDQISIKRFFNLWKNKINKESKIKNSLLEVISKQEGSIKGEYFYRWLQTTFEMIKEENKILTVQEQLHDTKLKRTFAALKQNWYDQKCQKEALSLLNQFMLTKREEALRYGHNQIKLAKKSQARREAQQHEGAKRAKRFLKLFDSKCLQRYWRLWKLSVVDYKSKYQRDTMKNQFLKRILQNIMMRKRQKQLSNAFRLFRQPYKTSSHNSDANLNNTINKLSSVAKITQILGNQSQEQKYFNTWRAKSKLIKPKEVSIVEEILNRRKRSQRSQSSSPERKSVERHSLERSQNSDALAILETKQKIGMNILKVLLYKQYKGQLQIAFQYWLLLMKKKKNQRQISLPPRNVQFQDSNIVQPNIFTITKQQSNQPSHSSSLQYSQGSKNLRYSNKDDEDDYMQDYEINNQFSKPTQPFEICVSDPKQHFGDQKAQTTKHGYAAGSMFAFYDSDGRPTSPIEGANDLQYSPESTARNQLASIEQSKDDGQKKKKKKKLSKSAGKPKEDKSLEEKKGGKDSKKASTKKKLNQYLSSDSSKGIISGGGVIKGTRDKKKNEKQSQERIEEPILEEQVKVVTLNFDESQPTEQQQQYQQTPVIKTIFDPNSGGASQLNRSKNFSPLAQVLETVPEEPFNEEKKEKKKSSSKNKDKLSNSLSSYLNSSQSQSKNTSKSSKEEGKHQKKISQEDRLKNFLNNKKIPGSSKVTPKPKEKQGKIQVKSEERKKEVEEEKKPKKTEQELKQQKFQFQYMYGLSKIETVINKKHKQQALAEICDNIYDEDWEQVLKDREYRKKVKKLEKAVQIREKIMESGRTRKWDAFAFWKRSDYLQMINSLKVFKEHLNLIYGSQ